MDFSMGAFLLFKFVSNSKYVASDLRSKNIQNKTYKNAGKSAFFVK